MARPALLEKRRQEFGRHLIRSLDVLSYCHLLYVYLMDISLLRLLLRSIVQLNYLTPKPFPIPRVARTPIVYFVILIANTYCLLVHLFANLPVSREANGGYLHGGLTIEFIGQKAPASRLQLICSDLIIVTLQIVILTISNNMNDEESPTTPVPTTLSAAAQLAAHASTRSMQPAASPTEPPRQQTLDDEERGHLQVAEEGSSSNIESSSSPDDIQLLRTPDEADGFSGEVVAVELHLTDIVGRTTHARRRTVSVA
ncbi:uncharacterized protein V1513DRAFT_457300 [Lipomyces chichibuensis]|uniref:uncharacterized protein n=1 Tax=Lipomyces chichibuensis TaxID=1546026 RepID=UPI0033435C49